MPSSVTRRFLLLSAPLLLGGCVTNKAGTFSATPPRKPSSYYRDLYGPITNEKFAVRTPDLTKIDPKFYRQEVGYSTSEIPGTIVVDTQQRFLYYILEGQRALRYGVGVGKAGLEFEGAGTIQYKREWPRWTPTSSMIARDPERYGPLREGMEPGTNNPLGARALYIFQNGADTLYRVHGTNEDWSIGKSVSSGCIRMLNHDVIDLHRRVRDGARIIVLQGPALTV
jgi:lipoprotein-anchoring transpeptidase ErfK/SrfK